MSKLASRVLVPIKGRRPLNLEKYLRPVGKPIVNKNACKGCSYCIEFCPVDVLELSKDVNIWGYQYPVIREGMELTCINCGMCERVCPELAIEVLEDQPVPYEVEWVE